MFPVTHKTVFVLDRSPCFNKSSRQSIEYDVVMKGKTPGIIPAAPISKTLWTCSVEAMLEYMRIVYDIFPEDKLVGISYTGFCVEQSGGMETSYKFFSYKKRK